MNDHYNYSEQELSVSERLEIENRIRGQRMNEGVTGLPTQELKTLTHPRVIQAYQKRKRHA